VNIVIVTNIIQNALRYAKSYLTITLIEEEDHIRLSAINDVEAFAHSERNQIFNRTFRLDTSRNGSHLGLGLHIVRELINKQGGNVAAEIQDNEFKIDVLFKKWD